MSLKSSLETKLHHSPISAAKISSKSIQKLLFTKYSFQEYQYTQILTHNLIFNEKCSIVSRFKDYLIYDDATEFFRRKYQKSEIYPRLKRILTFYESYSKIFPNYMTLPESEHLYRNIRKKQKMIDEMNAIKQEEDENRKKMAKEHKTAIEAYQSNSSGTVFTPKIQKSILKCQPSQINDQSSINEASVSIAIMMKKIVLSMDHSFDLNDYDDGHNDNENKDKDKNKNDIWVTLSNRIGYGVSHGDAKKYRGESNSIAEILNVMNDDDKIISSAGNIKTEDNERVKKSFASGSHMKNFYINVQQKKMNEHILIHHQLHQQQQTPKLIKKNIGNFYNSEHHKNHRNPITMSMSYGVRTNNQSKEKKVKKYTIASSYNSNGNNSNGNSNGNSISNSNVVNNINAPYIKPLNELNLLTSNYQNIIIPQSSNNGGNTVININNNYYSCTENSLSKSIKERIQSSSPPMTKLASRQTQSLQQRLYEVKEYSKLKNMSNTPKGLNKNSRSVKRVIASPLESFHAHDPNQISQNTMPSDREFNKEPKSKKSLYKSLIKFKQNNPYSNNHYNTNPMPKPQSKPKPSAHSKSKPKSQYNIIKGKTERHYSTNQSLKRMKCSNDTYNNSKFNTNVASPQRDRQELSKELLITGELRHKFTKFIERSQSKGDKSRDYKSNGDYSCRLTNRSSRIGYSRSPLKNSINILTKRISGNNTVNASLRKKHTTYNHKKNFSIDENYNKRTNPEKSLSSHNSKVMSPVVHSRYTSIVDSVVVEQQRETPITMIKVNTKAFMERTFSNRGMSSPKEDKSCCDIKERAGSSSRIVKGY